MNRTIIATANQSKRTFTLRIRYFDGSQSKYRTLPMSKQDFNNCLYNSSSDWQNFLNYGAYYKVK